MEMLDILSAAVAARASDVHIVIGKPPMIRLFGKVSPLPNFPIITPEKSKRLIYSMLYQDQIATFEERLELDFSYDIEGLSRFRVNVLSQKRGIEAALRIVPTRIPTTQELRITDAVVALTRLPAGLILVTGPTGSGKTTTIASLINVINTERREHILTIEDPIEYVFSPKTCIVRQREVGLNTTSFSEALKHALRQDPDVILVGEMRDLETTALALTAAETGHLVFSTLHTQSAPQTIERIVDVFPTNQQQQIRVQLASTLKAVISQRLLPLASRAGRIAVRETMIVTPAISNLIRENKGHQIYSAIETGLQHGMCTLETALLQLVREGLITPEEAFQKANQPDLLRTKLGTAQVKPRP